MHNFIEVLIDAVTCTGREDTFKPKRDDYADRYLLYLNDFATFAELNNFAVGLGLKSYRCTFYM